MCCLTQDPANPYTAYIIDCCTLKITNADGTLVDTFNLNDLDYQIANGILYLKDGVNTRTINVADAPAIFGLVDIAAVLAWIDASVTDCKCVTTPPPVPVTLDVLNCDGTTTPIIFDSAPAKVEIVQTRPFVMCKSNIDFEIGCSSIDGRTIVRTYIQNEDGTITSAIFEQDGVTPVADGSILVKCDIDIEDVEFCFQDITDTTIRYRQVVFVNTATNAVVSTIWIDSTGVAIAAPSNIEPCADADEIDLLHTNWLTICVDGVQWYVADKYTYNNITGLEGIPVKVYKQGANGAIVTVAPTGTVIADGICQVAETLPYNFVCIETPPALAGTNAFKSRVFTDASLASGTAGWKGVMIDATTQANILAATLPTNYVFQINSFGVTLPYPTVPITVEVNLTSGNFAFTTFGASTVLTFPNSAIVQGAQAFDKGSFGSAVEIIKSIGMSTIGIGVATETTYTQAQMVKSLEPDGTIIDKFYTIGETPTQITIGATDIITIGACPVIEQPTCDKQFFLRCDDINGDGSVIVEFIREVVTCYQEGTQVSRVATDYETDAITPYTPVNETNCPPSGTFDTELLYDSNCTPFYRVTNTTVFGTFLVGDYADDLATTPYLPTLPLRTDCEACNLTPDCCFCFCAMTLPIVKAAVKSKIAAKEAVAVKETMSKSAEKSLAREVKAVATTKPVKVNICITNWRDCNQTVVKRTYTIDGVDVPEATFLKLKYTKTVCADPIPTFTPGTPTCGTYVDAVYGVVVLNVTIFTNDANPTDTFTIYNLADNYTGLGNIGDVYLPADETLVSACNCSPLVDCITTTEECYKALVDVKGVANTGDTITVKVTNNAVTNTDYYEITHSTTNSLIYAGTDPVTDIGLDINNVSVWELSPCDPPAPEVFDILEKEVCGTIDGSTDTYELVRVYTRNPTTGAMSTLFYEDKFGNQITGVVVEVCCTCDTLCTVAPALPLLSSVTAYARSLTGQDGCGDKFVIGAGIQWQVKIYQNGTLILNSATSPILTSQAAAFTWLDSNAGGYWLNTTTLPWAFANNINTYQFVSPTDPDEYLMVLTETGNGASYCGGNLTSYRWAFTNKGVSLGLSCDNADAFAWSDLWADRTGWDWKC